MGRMFHTTPVKPAKAPDRNELLRKLLDAPESKLSAVAVALDGGENPKDIRLHTPAQAARRLGFTRWTLWQHVKNGSIKSVRIASGNPSKPYRTMIPASFLEEYAAGVNVENVEVAI